jgi:DNA-binding CsgD family transcriptional regulator
MKTDISHAEEINALLLSQGYTQKEVAEMRERSTRTISNQVDRFYKKTGCRNLADLTRFVVKRYSGIPVEDIIINALHDLSLMVAGAILFYMLSQPSAQAELSGAFSTLLEIMREQFQEWLYRPAGTF